jgi:methionyl-tRNA formyltransferase
VAAPRLRTLFFGSSEFSLPSLRRLAERHDVVAVVSQPDKPAGRGLRLTATPVSACARAQGLPLLTPAKLDAAFAASLAELRPEFLACASYGKIVPGAILGIPSLRAALNVHPSVLPQFCATAAMRPA